MRVFFFFYSSLLKVCLHARCSFGVGTCGVVECCRWRFSHVGPLERLERTWLRKPPPPPTGRTRAAHLPPPESPQKK